MDLVRPLGMAGIRCVTVSEPGAPPWYSRFVQAGVPWIDRSTQPDDLAEHLIDRLVDFGLSQDTKPVLFYEEDWELLLVSRFRNRLEGAFRFVIPGAKQVEDLVDKTRFQLLAEKLKLPVPTGVALDTMSESLGDDVDLTFPILVKPLSRRTGAWALVAGAGNEAEPKVLLVQTRQRLQELWPLLKQTGEQFLLQEVIPGPESAIESYHAYVDGGGEVVGQFTGRKIRTYPPALGYSTALVLSDAPDVARLGADVLNRLNFHGVAKVDFKRGSDGKLHLLEVNPRFNLWHHLGAHGGVNLPALVYNDLAGGPRRPVPNARAGARWCWLQGDARAAKSEGMLFTSWLVWALTCEARANLAWDDPMPFLRGVLWPRVRGFLPKVGSPAR